MGQTRLWTLSRRVNVWDLHYIPDNTLTMQTLHIYVCLVLSIFKMQEVTVAQCSGKRTAFVDSGEMRHPKDGLLKLTKSRHECAAYCTTHVNCREFLHNPTDNVCLIVELEQFPSPDMSYSSTIENTYYRRTKSDWCPAGDGYQLMSETGPCFKFFTDKKSWTDANQTCNSYSPPNSRFAIVDTEEKFLLMRAAGSAMNHKFNGGVWIGLSNYGGDGLRWVDGSALSYTNWGKSTDDNPDNCVTLFRSLEWKWYVYGCDPDNHYVCELTHPSET